MMVSDGVSLSSSSSSLNPPVDGKTSFLRHAEGWRESTTERVHRSGPVMGRGRQADGGLESGVVICWSQAQLIR